MDSLVLTLKEGLKCPLCKDFLKSPVQTNCLHAFCLKCIQKKLALGAECSVCGEIITSKRSSPIILQIVKELRSFEMKEQDTESLIEEVSSLVPKLNLGQKEESKKSKEAVASKKDKFQAFTDQLLAEKPQDQKVESSTTENTPRSSVFSEKSTQSKGKKVKSEKPAIPVSLSGKVEVPLYHLTKYMDENGLFPGISKGFYVKKLFEYIGIDTRMLAVFSMKPHEFVENVIVVHYVCKSQKQYAYVQTKLDNYKKGALYRVAEKLMSY